MRQGRLKLTWFDNFQPKNTSANLQLISEEYEIVGTDHNTVSFTR